MKKKNNVFSEMPVKQAVFKMAVPSVISSLVLVIYNMADTFFVGQTHNAMQVAAVSLTSPVFVMFMAFANLLGIGGSTAVSIFLGEKNNQYAKAVSSFSCYISVILGIIFGILILIFINPLLQILGSSANTYEFAKDYLFYIALGAPFILFANTFGHTVRGEGAAAASMIGGMIGTVVNIILDPVFILTLNMGTGGAAIATVLGNVFGCIYYIYYFQKKSLNLSIFLKDFNIFGKAARKTITLGIPAGINSGLMSISNIVLNNKLAFYGDAPLAAIILGIILTIIYIIFSSQIVEFFIDNNEVIKYGKHMLIATSISGPVLGILFLCINSMQAVDRPFSATIVSVCRQGFIFIPMVYILDFIFGLTGINYAQAAADYISIILSVILFKVSVKNIRIED